MSLNENINQEKSSDDFVLPDDAAKQMRFLLREVAGFVALYETLEEKIVARETALEEKLIASEELLNDQLEQIKDTLADFSTIMTETGAARWRLAAEKVIKESAEHLKMIEQAASTITQTIKNGCEQLGETTTQTANDINNQVQTFPINQFKQVVEQSGERINHSATTTIKQITALIRDFHWKNLATLFMVTLLVIIITGLFLNDEWPWETHTRVVKERNAGRALINAWPHLNPTERQDIMNYVNNKTSGDSNN